MALGSEKVYTVCLDCGEVMSIKILNPEKLKWDLAWILIVDLLFWGLYHIEKDQFL